MARRFAKFSEEIQEALFYASDLVNTKTTGWVKSGGYIPRRFASWYISTTIHLPFGDSCILTLATLVDSVYFYNTTLRHQYRSAKKIEILALTKIEFSKENATKNA